MKKIVFLAILTILGTVCFAQRNTSSRSSSSSRGSVSVSRSSSASPRQSSNRNGYSPSSRNTGAVYTPTRRSSQNSSINRRSEERSHSVTTNPTRKDRNTPRSQNNGSYSRPEHHSPITAPKSHAPHGRPHVHHTPHGMHPMPPMHHPIHHHRPIRMHYHPCHDWVVYNMYWYGYWSYVRAYPFNDVVVYVNNKYPSTTVVAVSTDDTYVYTIYRDERTGITYFTITDQSDNILVKTQVNRKYCRIMTDENGVWLLRKNNRYSMYFMYQDGNLYQYEED